MEQLQGSPSEIRENIWSLLKSKKFYKELMFSLLCPPYGVSLLVKNAKEKQHIKNANLKSLDSRILSCWNLLVEHSQVTERWAKKFTEVWIPLQNEDNIFQLHWGEKKNDQNKKLLYEASLGLSMLQVYMKKLANHPKYIFWFSNLAPILARYGFKIYDDVNDFYKESGQYYRYFKRGWNLTEKEKQQKERIKKWKIPQVAMISTEDFLKIDFEKFIKK